MKESAPAQLPAESPAQALSGNGAQPGAKVAAEEYDREGIVRAPPCIRSAPSAAVSWMIPEWALEFGLPESAPPRAVLTGVTIVQVRKHHCKQVLRVMHQCWQEGEVVRPSPEERLNGLHHL